LKISNFFENFKKQIFSSRKQCPNCGVILRFPNNKGKLKVTCPNCHTHFIVQFQKVNPFNFDKNISRKANFDMIKQNFKNLYQANPWLLWFLILVFSFLIYWVVQSCGGEPNLPLNQGTGV